MLRVKACDIGGLKAAIREKALELGFDDVGHCSAAPFPEWFANAYEPVRSRLAHDPRALMPDAKSIVVAVRRYAAFGPWPEGAATIANYYVNSTVGFEQTKYLAALLEEHGCSAAPNPLLPAKQAAVRAGLGVQGMNTQFCHKTLGMLVSIHMVLTNADLASGDSPYAVCGKCGLCAAACPTGAVYDGGFGHENCLRFLMASGSLVPPGMRDRMGLMLTGCTFCQHACPNADIKTEEVPPELAWACDIAGLLRGEKERYDKLAEIIGDNFARLKRIRAQAAICAGNSGNRAYVPLLAALLGDGSDALRIHAAWALGKLGGAEARAALSAAVASEQDGGVLQELSSALAAALPASG